MGYDIQINPTAEAFRISFDLFVLIDRYATDFEMKYCHIRRNRRLLAALRALTPRDETEGHVILELIYRLEQGEIVELLFGW